MGTENEKMGVCAKRLSASEWAEIIKEQQRAGISDRSFARERGVSYCQLLHWRGKAEIAGRAEPSFGFKELGVIKPHCEYRVSIGGSVELTIPSGRDISEVAALVRALKWRDVRS